MNTGARKECAQSLATWFGSILKAEYLVQSFWKAVKSVRVADSR